MRVLSAHAGADTGGIGYGLARAFARHSTGVEVRSSVRAGNYIAYPQDLPWDEAPGYGRHADVVHVHNTFRTALLLGLAGKPKVIHHHGTHYRDNSPALDRETRAAGAVPVCSTVDLLDYADGLTELTWIPAAYDFSVLPKRKPRPGKLRIGHAPTNRAIKSTDAFLEACGKFDDVEPVLIEGRTWADCLRIKATCDVYFDQVTLGYGCNAIEAWGMGIPVIAGAQQSTLDRMHTQFGQLPFLLTDEASIADAIWDMLDDGMRALYTAVGVQHAQRWHNGAETAQRLTRIYEGLAT